MNRVLGGSSGRGGSTSSGRRGRRRWCMKAPGRRAPWSARPIPPAPPPYPHQITRQNFTIRSFAETQFLDTNSMFLRRAGFNFGMIVLHNESPKSTLDKFSLLTWHGHRWTTHSNAQCQGIKPRKCKYGSSNDYGVQVWVFLWFC